MSDEEVEHRFGPRCGHNKEILDLIKAGIKATHEMRLTFEALPQRSMAGLFFTDAWDALMPYWEMST